MNLGLRENIDDIFFKDEYIRIIMGILKEKFEGHPKLQPLLNTENTNKNKIQPTEETTWNRGLNKKRDSENNQFMNLWNQFYRSLENSIGTAVHESLSQEHFTSLPVSSRPMSSTQVSSSPVSSLLASSTSSATSFFATSTPASSFFFKDKNNKSVIDLSGNKTDQSGNEIDENGNIINTPSNMQFVIDTSNSPETRLIYRNSVSVFTNTFSKLDKFIPIMNAFFQKFVFYLAKNYVSILIREGKPYNKGDSFNEEETESVKFVAEMFFTMILLPFCLIFSYNWFFLLCYSQIFNPEKKIIETAINISNSNFYKKNIVPLSEWYILRYLFESPFDPLMWLDYFLLTFVVGIIKNMVGGIGYLLLYYGLFALFSWLLLDSLLNTNLESGLTDESDVINNEIDENSVIYTSKYNGFYNILKIICMSLIIVSGVKYFIGDVPNLVEYIVPSIVGVVIFVIVFLFKYVFRILLNISDPFLVISVLSVILYLFIYSFLAIPLYSGLDYKNFMTVKQYVSLFLQYNGEYDIKNGEFKKEITYGPEPSQEFWCKVKLCMSIFFSHNSFLTLIIIFCITLLVKNFVVSHGFLVKFVNLGLLGLITVIISSLKFYDTYKTFNNEWIKVRMDKDKKYKTFWEGIWEGILILMGPFSGST